MSTSRLETDIANIVPQFDMSPKHNYSLAPGLTEVLIVQSQEPSASNKNGHRDKSIRNFYKALVTLAQKNKPSATLTLINEAYQLRTDSNAHHMADLIARAFQFALRQQTPSRRDYQNYSVEQWVQQLENLSDGLYTPFQKALSEYNVSTHVVERYRGLAAILAGISKTQSGDSLARGLRVTDWGGSAGWGIPASVEPGYLLGSNTLDMGEIEDLTPNHLITQLIRKDNIHLADAFSVDVLTVIPAWVLACSYFCDYDSFEHQLKSLQSDLIKLKKYQRTQLIEDIATSHPENLLPHPNYPKLNVIHASMVMYQLNPEQRLRAFQNAHQLLDDGGIFVELAFIKEDDWFSPWNIHTTVRINLPDGLSEPYEWLIWSNSRCQKVKPGKDFNTVNNLVGISTN